MPGLNLKAAQWEQQHKTHVEEYLRQIEALYDVASDELIRLGMGYKYQPNTGRLFAFSSNKSRSKNDEKKKPMPRYLHSEISCPL